MKEQKLKESCDKCGSIEMTDGIIQKILDKYIEEYYSYLQSTKDRQELQYTHYEGIIRHFEKAKQELIEEIEKAFPIEKPFQHVYGCSQIQRKLIGET